MTEGEIFREIVKLCRKYGVRQVYLYGARARGNYHERSDYDIAVAGASDFFRLREEIYEIPTLYTIEVVDLDTCENRFILGDIDEYGRRLYETV